MEGYFIIVSERCTLKRVELYDVANEVTALDIYKTKVEEGYAVSVWKGIRIRVSHD